MKNQTTQVKNIYKDFDLSFTRHPLTGDVAVKNDANAIEQSLRSLISTNYYDRGFHPEIGSNIRASLFEMVDPITMTDLRNSIAELINNFEPRVRLINIIVEDFPDRNAYNITLVYNYANAPAPVTLKIVLERLR